MIYTEEKIGYAVINDEGSYKIDHMFYEGLNGTMVVNEDEFCNSISDEFGGCFTLDDQREMFRNLFIEQEDAHGTKAKLVKMTVTLEIIE